MTSDDTKVDTSDWAAGEDFAYRGNGTLYEVHAILDGEAGEPLGTFDDPHIRDACLLAIQSLPKVTAERDDAVQQRNTLGQLAYETAEQRDVALSEVSALSARVKELTEGVRTAYGMLLACGFENPEDDPELAASWQASVDKVRALIGKEPS